MSAGQMFFAAVAWFPASGWLAARLADTPRVSHNDTLAALLLTAGWGWKERCTLHLWCDVVTLIFLVLQRQKDYSARSIEALLVLSPFSLSLCSALIF